MMIESGSVKVVSGIQKDEDGNKAGKIMYLV